ncbi:baseplate J/gp47 family protein [Lysinibacillus sp. 3P01SB]|uniref:baseplate J/gp47 family protein n=1 Tax=Lysinibacillus sp. 3P01SB TaxID=3132284 RepID=UPI0039A517F2
METVQEIHSRMLANTSSELDRSNGSFVFDVERAAAIEFNKQQESIAKVQSKLDIYNLTGDELTRYVYQRTGIKRRPATKATVQVIISGAEGAEMKVGDAVATDSLNFVSLENQKIGASGSMVVAVESELPGRAGNIPANHINRFPITIPGLVNVYNPEPTANGYEAETDDELRQRYFDKLQRPGKAGNKYHYEEWAKEVPGVGAVKVFPRFNGPLTMHVILIDQNGMPAPTDLVEKVRTHIEEEMPFGVEELLIEAAKPLVLDLTVDLILAEGYLVEKVITNIKANISDYLKKIALTSTFVSYAKIGAMIIESEGALDYQNLFINGTAANIAIAEDEVAVMGGVNE